MILCIAILMVLTSCDTIKDYNGTPITALSYETEHYDGSGYTVTHIFDFENNVVKKREHWVGKEENSDFSIIASFSDEEETVLINKLYSFGLFDIKDNYKAPPLTFDGSGWSLLIQYGDGTVKESKGANNSPTSVFKDCAKAFYDICENGIVAYVPSEYYSPPNISYSFNSESKHMGYTSYGERVNYQWNGFQSTENNIYEANISTDFKQKFDQNTKYTLVLYTANYGDFDRFKTCTVTTFDYHEDLTNPTIVYSDKWFKQVEFDLQLNKIYLIR